MDTATRMNMFVISCWCWYLMSRRRWRDCHPLKKHRLEGFVVVDVADHSSVIVIVAVDTTAVDAAVVATTV